ncbi:MAG TPA: hypothetical protein VF120_08995 [Ktedonobacterales bacterium]
MCNRTLRHILLASVVLLAVVLPACSSETTIKGPITVPLKVESASMKAEPASYSGPCSGTQQLTFTATLTANPSNAGGKVHYVWTINRTVSEGDATFGLGEVTKTLTQTYAYNVPADAGPELRASFVTTTPNEVSAPDSVISIACTVPFQIIDVSVTMQPWSTDCGPHTFGWSATLTAPWNNTGGQVQYAWRFGVGAEQYGTITFAPGQITAVVSAAQSYSVVPNGQPTTDNTGWPEVSPSEVIAWLYVTSPNGISDYASLDHYSC